MKKTFNRRKKAVVTSIMTILILCSATIAVSPIQASNTIDIKNNVEKSYYTNLYNNIFSIFLEELEIDEFSYNSPMVNKWGFTKNNNLMDFLFDLSSNSFLEKYKTIGNSNNFKFENSKIALYKIIAFLNQFRNIINFNGESYEINSELKDLMEGFSFETESNPINYVNDDFDLYWEKYEEMVALWQEKFGSSSCQDWFDDIKYHIDTIKDSQFIPLAASFALCVIPIEWVSAIGWVLIAYILAQVYDFAAYVLDGYNYYAVLKERQVNIVLYVYELVNTTEGGTVKRGIDGLWEDKGIEAKNTDAIANCNGDNGKTVDLFTYYMGPAEGTEEPGWYSLANRNIAEEQERDLKSPHPPGDWTIEIEDTDIYFGNLTQIDNIKQSNTIILEMQLDLKP